MLYQILSVKITIMNSEEMGPSQQFLGHTKNEHTFTHLPHNKFVTQTGDFNDEHISSTQKNNPLKGVIIRFKDKKKGTNRSLV